MAITVTLLKMEILSFLVSFAIIGPTLGKHNSSSSLQNKLNFEGENCDHLGILLYEDLGCTPEYEGTKSCPIRYKCLGLEETKIEDLNNCYFRGKNYTLREPVENSLSKESCDIGCFCSGVLFTCAVLDCPEWLAGELKPGCYRTYSLNECCATGSSCPPFTHIQTCTVDGIEYKEGQRFYPENTCQRCVCQKGFNGKYEEPFCRRQRCGVQLKRSSAGNLRSRCAPLYGKRTEKTLCCPEGWVCHDGSENITGVMKRDDVCKFGDITLKVGQGFEKHNIKTSWGTKIEKVTCECILPPLLTCNQVLYETTM